MNLKTIQVEKQDRMGIITLNRPDKRNAISIEMRQEISACLQRWRDDPEIGVVIFTGAGKIFSAGFDLDEFKQPDCYAELYESSVRYHRDVWNFPKPVIAAINGPAVGGGFDLVTLCDVRICSGAAYFGHPEIKFGAPPIFTPLRLIVGDGLARDLCLTGRRIDAHEASRRGLVSEVIALECLTEKAEQLAATMLEAPIETLMFAKKVSIDSAGRDFEQFFQVEHDRAFRELILT